MSDSFSDWASKLAEASCVLKGIPCKRKFTDAELERPLEEIRRAAIQAEDIYVNEMIKREQRERHEGRAEHDMDVFGRSLRAGT